VGCMQVYEWRSALQAAIRVNEDKLMNQAI
jgi:hypothetical protein